MAADFDVARDIAHPHVAMILVHRQPRIARHMDGAIDGHAESGLLRHGEDNLARREDGIREAVPAGECRRNDQFLIGAPAGHHADLFESFFRVLLLLGFEETIGRLGYDDLDFRFVPSFHGQIAVGVFQSNGAARLEIHALRGGNFE